MTHWLALSSPEAVAEEACRRIEAAAQTALSKKEHFSLVLAGGSTPLAAYTLLAQRRIPDRRWQLYFGDERCLPVSHPERNSQMIQQTGLSDLAGEVHLIPAELPADEAAAAYAGVVEKAQPFDMVLLGMGADGHTASLFPGHPEGQGSVVPVYNSPKPPAERVSLTRAALQDGKEMLVMVTGEGKREALAEWKQGGYIPIASVAECAHCTVLVEEVLLEPRA